VIVYMYIHMYITLLTARVDGQICKMPVRVCVCCVCVCVCVFFVCTNFHFCEHKFSLLCVCRIVKQSTSVCRCTIFARAARKRGGGGGVLGEVPRRGRLGGAAALAESEV